MGWLDRVPDRVAELRHARALMEASRSAEACVVLDRVIVDAVDPYTRADALVQRLSALINLGRTAEYTVAVDDAFDAAREIGEPYVYGALHALCALAAHTTRARSTGASPTWCRAPATSAPCAIPTARPRGAGTTWRWPTPT